MSATPLASADSVAILGLKATHGGKSLGVLSEFGFTPNIETTDIFTVENGLRQLLRRIVTSVSVTLTFTTLSVLDAIVRDLFTGGEDGKLTFQATEGALVITRRNAEAGRKQVVINIPKAALRGTGTVGAPGAEAAGYQFEAVALLEGDAEDLGEILIQDAPAGLRNQAIQQAVAEGNVTRTEVDFDPAKISIDDAKAKVEAGDVTARTMLALETAHKNRPTFVPWLEERAAKEAAAEAEAEPKAA